MNWITTKNNETINLSTIPIVDMTELRPDIIYQVKHQKRVVGFFGKLFKNIEGEKINLFIVLADDEKSELLVSSSVFNKGDSYQSITQAISTFHMFEREFYEEFGIKPTGHPWLKPVRNHKTDYPFFKMDGEDVHEVAVGPIHAGVIEPGHFRFMCHGEKIYDLEIQLGYQHRSVEHLFIQNNGFSSQLAESIAGDTVIGHNLAYSNVMESFLNVEISNKAAIIRLICLEMERIAIHIGDLGAISNDVAYLMGNSVFGAIRTLVINTLLEISGSRFGRGLIRVGGVLYDIDTIQAEKIVIMLDTVLKNVERMANTMFASASVMSRLEKTGILSKENAKGIGLVGIAARASGIPLDIRVDHPCKWLKDSNLEKIVMQNGDVYSRTYIRYKEIKQSTQLIKDLLMKLVNFKDEPIYVTPKNNSLPSNNLAISMVEGWRGEIVHIAITDEKGVLSRYKIKDPSFNNWYGLAVAVRNNGISDFPLCNKSFNLSYCGNDL